MFIDSICNHCIPIFLVAAENSTRFSRPFFLSRRNNLVGQHWDKVTPHPTPCGQSMVVKKKRDNVKQTGLKGAFTPMDVGEGMVFILQGIFQTHIYTISLIYKNSSK